MTTLTLHIVSPEGTLVSGAAVTAVRLPGAQAPFTVLPGHAGIITPLIAGEVQYDTADGPQSLTIRSGFVRVVRDTVELAVETA